MLFFFFLMLSGLLERCFQAAVGTEELWVARQCEKSFISMRCLSIYEHEYCLFCSDVICFAENNTEREENGRFSPQAVPPKAKLELEAWL